MADHVPTSRYTEVERLPNPDTDMRTVYYVVEPDELDMLMKRNEGRWTYTIYGWIRVPRRHQHDWMIPPGNPRLPAMVEA